MKIMKNSFALAFNFCVLTCEFMHRNLTASLADVRLWVSGESDETGRVSGGGGKLYNVAFS